MIMYEFLKSQLFKPQKTTERNRVKGAPGLEVEACSESLATQIGYLESVHNNNIMGMFQRLREADDSGREAGAEVARSKVVPYTMSLLSFPRHR